MNDYLFALKLFARVARRGNFSAAGREFNLPQPSVSRIISSLEQEVGVVLLNRTTRAVNLTDAGVEFLERIEPILLALDEAAQAVRGSGELRGTLRLGLPSSFALRAVVPLLPDFLSEHPKLKVEFILDDMRQNLIADGVDVSVRFGQLIDSSTVVRKLGETPKVIVASPAYLKKYGTPKVPTDLSSHRTIFGPQTSGQAWSFRKEDQAVSVRIEGAIVAAFNEVGTASSVAGLGIHCLSEAGCYKELKDGSLIRLLPDWDMGSIEVNALFTSGRASKPSAKAFFEYLKSQLGQFGIR
ncbi:LysR family transcriptional regulator [Duganella callida]|uniref:LysR family transcriptional regulator n=1 Tax=Duganella callida TaxID=2561932 RepID=A0A4Y9SA65_9BURK|nr:LysR family transcriptional regulator [Duganella callida]TFW18676.1 LysR family transcriptional regulator [Duganella callida]